MIAGDRFRSPASPSRGFFHFTSLPCEGTRRTTGGMLEVFVRDPLRH